MTWWPSAGHQHQGDPQSRSERRAVPPYVGVANSERWTAVLALGPACPQQRPPASDRRSHTHSHTRTHTVTHTDRHKYTSTHNQTQTHLVIQTQTVTCSLTRRHTQRKKEREGKPQAASQETGCKHRAGFHFTSVSAAQATDRQHTQRRQRFEATGPPLPRVNAWLLFGISQARPRGGT